MVCAINSTDYCSFTPNRLCDVRFTSVRANINLKNVTVNSRTGDFNPTSLAHVINTDTVNDLIVKTWLDRACTSLYHCIKVVLIRRCTLLNQRHENRRLCFVLTFHTSKLLHKCSVFTGLMQDTYTRKHLLPNVKP